MSHPDADLKPALPAGERRRQIVGVLGLTLGPVLVVAMWFTANLWRHAMGTPLPYEDMLVPLGVGLIATGFGLNEWLNRQTRQLVRETAQLARDAVLQRAEERVVSDERHQVTVDLHKLIGEVSDRLQAMQSASEEWSEGVVQGMELAAKVRGESSAPDPSGGRISRP